MKVLPFYCHSFSNAPKKKPKPKNPTLKSTALTPKFTPKKQNLCKSKIYKGFCGEYRIRTDHLLPARQAL